MIRTRFAPSPTGFLHIGGLRTALYSYALAKHDNGQFILRIEDTDQKREIPGATEALQGTLGKFGLVWDEYHLQSQRHKSGVYTNAAQQLLADNRAFYCQCQPKNAKAGYSSVLRDPCREKNLAAGAIKLKVPNNRTVSYYDFVHKKEISWDTNLVYDATLVKSDGYPTYHLAAMVDDIDTNISHILRGHDWLPSTPVHLLVLDYLGSRRPEIGHLTDILSGITGKKLSKRRDSVFCEQFLDSGYLPEALLNFVMLLGWAPKDNSELFTLDEFVQSFDPIGFQEANPRFHEEKLNWFNGHYIRQKSNQGLIKLLWQHLPADASLKSLEQILPLVKDRIVKLSDFASIAGFFYSPPDIAPALFTSNGQEHLRQALKTVQETSLETEALNSSFKKAIEINGFKTGDFFMDLRIAMTGSRSTPPITESIVILGKNESIQRITNALDLITQ